MTDLQYLSTGDNMHMLRFSAAALLVVSITFTATAGGDGVKALQGAWTATITEIDGKAPTKEEAALKLVLVVQGEKYRVLHNKEEIQAGTYKIDATKTPHTIDVTHGVGPSKGMVQKGIYEIKEDTMTAVFAKPGKDRPTEFKTKEGSEQAIVKYVRLK
jgi:uncharacterized protein (TIGR03067 family)